MTPIKKDLSGQWEGDFQPLMTKKEIELIINLILENLSSTVTIVELGCYMGGTTLQILKCIGETNAKIYAVESFVINGSSIRERVIENFKKYPQIELWEMSTNRAAVKFFKPIDFLFVDADHQDHSMLEDCAHWLSKVKSGGIVVFDDYNNADFPSVAFRVNEACRMWECIGEVDAIKAFRKP